MQPVISQVGLIKQTYQNSDHHLFLSEGKKHLNSGTKIPLFDSHQP